MRGKQRLTLLCEYCIRITPADAGKTWHLWTKTAATEDHPRGCGENLRSRALRRHRTGSPPRMRGKRDFAAAYRRDPRITPADAGKTPAVHAQGRVSQDHPRGCGENDFFEIIGYVRIGSPPRMRGKRQRGRIRADRQRITPADAGKTVSGGQVCGGAGDHPRGCGENCPCRCRP